MANFKSKTETKSTYRIKFSYTTLGLLAVVAIGAN